MGGPQRVYGERELASRAFSFPKKNLSGDEAKPGTKVEQRGVHYREGGWGSKRVAWGVGPGSAHAFESVAGTRRYFVYPLQIN